MKRLRPLLLILLLVLIAGGGFYYFRYVKKPKRVKPKPPPISQPTPSPVEELAPTVPPGLITSPRPVGTPFPMMTPPPFPTPKARPEEGIPHAESLPTETQPVIQVSLASPLKLAEGTAMILEPQVSYAGKVRLQYLWKVLSGPEDKIRITKATDAQPRLTLDDLEEPTEFNLRLNITDGQTEAIADLKINAFPARLSPVKKAGGAVVGLQHMGGKWVAGRGSDLEIYNPDMTPLARVSLDRPIAQFFAILNGEGKGAIFVQAPEGQWAVVQSDPTTGSKKTELPMLGKDIRRVVPFVLEGAPYMFALLERGIELWNLSEPRHPRLKTTQGGFLKDPLYLAFLQRNVYVAEEDSIHLIDFSTGNLVASVSSGGSVTSLSTYPLGGKNYLLASIGVDRSTLGRKDFGLHLFEITESGKLGSEKRLALKGNAPVQKAVVIPGAQKALLSVQGEKGLELRLFDLAQQQEVPLNFPPSLSFLALSDFEAGKIGENPVAVVADGNQLLVLAFKPAGNGYNVSLLQNIPGLVSAAWVQATSDGNTLWVGDEGTKAGGGLAILDGLELRVLQALNAPHGTYPVDADYASGAPSHPLLFISEDPQTLAPSSPEGRLGLSTSDPKNPDVQISKPFIGTINPQGKLRPNAVAGRGTPEGLRIGIAIARITGAIGGSGLAILDKPGALGAKAFLEGDLAKLTNLIPLQDARDVALTPEGKGAFVAAGAAGVISLDLEKKSPVARMSLGSNEWIADRISLGHQGEIVLASFVKPSSRQVMIKIFGVNKNLQMQEYGTITGLTASRTVEGLRAPGIALTEDDLYLFTRTQTNVLAVFNLTDPGNPVKIIEAQTDGDIRGVALANKFKDVFVALGPGGVQKFEFGF